MLSMFGLYCKAPDQANKNGYAGYIRP